MYKFSNGLVFYTKTDADKAIQAGYKLIEQQMDINEVIDKADETTIEPIIESDTTIEKPTRKNKRSIH